MFFLGFLTFFFVTDLRPFRLVTIFRLARFGLALPFIPFFLGAFLNAGLLCLGSRGMTHRMEF